MSSLRVSLVAGLLLLTLASAAAELGLVAPHQPASRKLLQDEQEFGCAFGWNPIGPSALCGQRVPPKLRVTSA
ncbi:hypothetical protein WJX81_003679 [Elliptochloris bilobata]|uniref:Uncharacterized protein n=1 Tax=Elliptochloris bilobata TaxID=381761 RepID=A0AAW1SA06_9CHLO